MNVKTKKPTKTISRDKIVSMIKDSKGYFMTVEFLTKKGTIDRMNGQYVKSSLNRPYVKIKQNGKKNNKRIRKIDNLDLKTLSFGGFLYKTK